MIRMLSIVLIFAAFTPQEKTGQSTTEQIERLRDERPGEREDAERKLLQAGAAALPELRKAASDADLEVAHRAGRLIQILEAFQTLSSKVLVRIPRAEALLAGIDDHGWTEVFLRAHEVPGISRETLLALAPRALLGIRDPLENPDPLDRLLRKERRAFGEDPADELQRVLTIIADRDLQSGVPTLLIWLSHPHPLRRELAALVLGHLRVKNALPGLRQLLQDPDPDCRADAATALGALGMPEAIPQLAMAVTDESETVSSRAMAAFQPFPRGEAYAALRRLYDQDGIPRRGNLINALLELRPGRQAHPRIGYWTRGLADVEPSVGDALIDPEHPQAASRLLPLLKDPRPGVRSGALLALREIRARETGDAMVPLLHDPEPYIRSAAAETLGDFGCASAIPDLQKLLEDNEVRVRSRAALSLGKLKSELALPALLNLMDDPDPEVRKYTGWALEALAHPKSAARFVQSLKDSDKEVCQTAMRTLWMIAPVDSLPAIAKRLGQGESFYWFPTLPQGDRRAKIVTALGHLLQDPDPDIRMGLLRLFSDLYLKDAGTLLIPLADDPVPEIRTEAVRTLAWLGVRKAAGKIVSKIPDETGNMRVWACWKLDDLGADAVPELLRFFERRGYDEHVAEALVNFCSREAIPPLVGFLNHKDPAARATILGFLASLKAKDSVKPISALLGDPEASVRKTAIETLARLGAREALPDLRKSLRDSLPEVRKAAVEALGRLRLAEAVADLRELLEDGASEVRAAAARVLGDFGIHEAAATLVGLLEDCDYSVRQNAARSLGKLGVREAVPRLLVLFRREVRNGWSASGASEALADLNVREAFQDLLRLFLQDLRSCGDSESTLPALKKLDPKATVSALLQFIDHEEMVPRRFAYALSELRTKGSSPTWGCPGEPRSTLGLIMGALVELEATEAIPVLRRIQRDRDEGPRWPVTHALIRLADADMSRELVGFLHHEHYSVRTAALEKLGQLGRRDVVPDILPLLEDVVSDIRRTAISTLEKLVGREALPAVLPLLGDPDRWVRVQAASTLCRQGDRRGVSLLVEEGHELNSLNAIREPLAWSRLREKPLAAAIQGDTRRLLAQVATQADLALEIPEVLPILFESDLSQTHQLTPERSPTLLRVMDQLMQGLERGCYVLDADRIRLISPMQARKFWESWATHLKDK